METVSLVVSVTERKVIVSKYITDAADIPPFSVGNVSSGRVTVVEETKNAIEPTIGVAVTGGSVWLTDGVGVVYATATGTPENQNELTFDLDVSGAELDAALAEAVLLDQDYISAVLEIRAEINGDNEMIAREPVVIQASASVLA